MASFFITTNSTTVQSLLAGENGFVGVNGTLYTENNSAVSVFGNATLAVMGTVATAEGFAGVRTASGAAVGSFDLTVGAQGTILSTTTNAVDLSVSGSLQLMNAGLISGQTGVLVDGSFLASVSNSGTILSNFFSADSGGNGGVVFGEDVDSAYVNNSGVIQVGGYGVGIRFKGRYDIEISNSGTISGSGQAIWVDSKLNLFNVGEIIGDVWSAGTATITNSGGITGSVDVWGNADIVNTGRISGSVGGMLVTPIATETVSITNAGQIGGRVVLGLGDDSFTNSGGTVAGKVLGGGGNDTYFLDSGSIVIEDTSGIDTVYSSASYRMGLGVDILYLEGSVGLAGTGRDQSEQIFGTDLGDTLRGGFGSDTLQGNDGDDIISGGTGNDALSGGSGNDLVDAHTGNDLLVFSGGFDTLAGGSGRDTLAFVGLTQGVVVTLAQGSVTITDLGGEVSGSATLTGIEDVTGTLFADVLTGSNGANLLVGGNGNDTLIGGNGEDTLIGGSGQDELTGGGQADTFLFAAFSDSATGNADQIAGFQRAVDVIDLSDIYAAEGIPFGVPFDFIGTAAFTAAGPQVRYVTNTTDQTTTIQIRLPGSLTNDMEIVLTSVVALLETNFIL